MMCPHCGHPKNRITDVEQRPEFDLRHRMCCGCGKKFQSLDRVAVYAGRKFGHQQVGPDPVLTAVDPKVQVELPPTEKAPGRKRLERFDPPDDYPLFGIDEQLRPLLLQWWRESRWSKHRSNATWTEAAFQGSITRLAALPPDRQRQLVEAAVEFGWQALKINYLDPVKGMGQARPTATGRPMPKDPSMLAALDSWPSTAA